MIYLGADHRGYYLKETIKKFFQKKEIKFEDLGNFSYNKNDDYPEFAQRVAAKVSQNSKKDKGILICGFGIGMAITANKFKNVRAAFCLSPQMAEISRQHNKANILCLSAEMTHPQIVFKIIDKWLKAKFTAQQRHQRRLKKIQEIEKNNFR